jgi:hypothetical protein
MVERMLEVLDVGFCAVYLYVPSTREYFGAHVSANDHAAKAVVRL